MFSIHYLDEMQMPIRNVVINNKDTIVNKFFLVQSPLIADISNETIWNPSSLFQKRYTIKMTHARVLG